MFSRDFSLDFGFDLRMFSGFGRFVGPIKKKIGVAARLIFSSVLKVAAELCPVGGPAFPVSGLLELRTVVWRRSQV